MEQVGYGYQEVCFIFEQRKNRQMYELKKYHIAMQTLLVVLAKENSNMISSKRLL